MQPLTAWRCIGWSDLTLNFFVAATPDRQDLTSPDGWVVDGAEALIELVLHLSDVRFAVHVMARKEAHASITLCRVTGLWKELEDEIFGTAGYWYSTADGHTRPCSPITVAKSAEIPQLMKLMNFENT
ncbi:hypothetical protein [Paraburkholderia kirstenboschensis]|uniref:Uncharacterized protein n=1 Tax=Paraburkholderia kirstenboschensis TaxID=1245436 RepID=A0ABZ0EIS1_9BURK|nr:hypothetical protein [Paraburkholderia kirstenboschensis]WOD17128.1 hypothetical protein RW095_14980 [Paraburkholderia kirstenboschensis]